MAEPITVDVDYSYEGEKRFYAVSLSTDTWMVLIHIAPEDLGRLNDVAATPWDEGALRIGDSAGAPVFWSASAEDDTGAVAIMVGQDDETWDISFAVPAATIGEILEAVTALDAP